MRGSNLLNWTIEKLDSKKVVPSEVVWRLCDTYGFPVALIAAEEKGLKLIWMVIKKLKSKQ